MQIKFSQSQLKAFFGSFIVMFLVMSLHLAGIRPHFRLISPIASQKPDIFLTIVPKLNAIKNTYSISKKTSFIPKAAAADDYEQASAYGTIDFTTGSVLSDKNLDEKLPIASLTKIMTCVVALDLMNKDDLITISKNAPQVVPTKIGVVPGEQMAVSELVAGAIMTSANDAAQALHDGINDTYGSDIFIRAMNEKAKLIGLTHTHFANPQGFDDPGNYSTVSDLAVLAHYALTNYPVIADFAKKDYMLIPGNGTHKQFDLYNWNGLIGVYPDTIGLKIGNTGDAGYTTVVLSNRNNHEILAVVLGAPGVLKRDEWASELLDAGYQQTDNLDPMNVSEDMLRAKYATWKYWN